jgi:conjugative relaxase-like TrwC/TraI family protein
MISIGKPRDLDYYLAEAVGQPLAYYATDRRGVASGRLASDLGFEGPVDRSSAQALLSGQTPDGTRIRATKVERSFFDVTASPPKSVSVYEAAAVGDQRDAAVAALQHANRSMLEFLEAEACVVRRGHGGLDQQPGSGMAVVSFTHTTSRADDADPQFHNHNLILNASTGPDGRTTALDTRKIYEQRYAADAVYQAVLRHEMATSLGVLFTEPDIHGTAEIVGIDKSVRDEFSQRRRQIETDMADRGTVSAQAARISTLATRTAKGAEAASHDQRRVWWHRFEEIGFDLGQVPTVERTPVFSPDFDRLAFELTEKSSTFERRHVVASVAHAAHDGASLHDIMASAGQFMASEHCIEVARGTYTTPEILELETATARVAVEGQGHVRMVTPLVPTTQSETVDRVIAQRPNLSEEQQRLVQTVATSGNRVDVVIGAAGSGKTYALDALRAAFEAQGQRVIGASLAATAAQGLEHGAGIPSVTVHRLLNQRAGSNPVGFDYRTVLVVDEAAMVGTRQLAAIVDEADRRGGKVVLVGDPKQLPEIDAGGTFAAIARRIPHAQLTDNHRQTNPDEREALRSLRRDDVEGALGHLHRAGSLTIGDNTDQVRSAMVTDWAQTFRREGDSLMLATRRRDVDDLNERARVHLKDAGRLGPDLVTTDTASFARGDRVIGLRNDYRADILNGIRAVVQETAYNGGLRLLLPDGTNRVATKEYLEAGHLTHGYALTVHKAQGITVDNAYLLGDDTLYAELGYTGLSRARTENRFYNVVNRNELGKATADPLQHVRRSLNQRNAQPAAIDHAHDLGISR